MPGKGKRRVRAGPMDPRKTREPVTGHPDAGYESDASMATAPPPPEPAPPSDPRGAKGIHQACHPTHKQPCVEGDHTQPKPGPSSTSSVLHRPGHHAGRSGSVGHGSRSRRSRQRLGLPGLSHTPRPPRALLVAGLARPLQKLLTSDTSDTGTNPTSGTGKNHHHTLRPDQTQTGSNVPLDRGGQQEHSNFGDLLAGTGAQKSRKAGFLVGHLPKEQRRRPPRGPHGEEALPHHTVRLGEIGGPLVPQFPLGLFDGCSHSSLFLFSPERCYPLVVSTRASVFILGLFFSLCVGPGDCLVPLNPPGIPGGIPCSHIGS